MYFHEHKGSCIGSYLWNPGHMIRCQWWKCHIKKKATKKSHIIFVSNMSTHNKFGLQSKECSLSLRQLNHTGKTHTNSWALEKRLQRGSHHALFHEWDAVKLLSIPPVSFATIPSCISGTQSGSSTFFQPVTRSATSKPILGNLSEQGHFSTGSPQ